MIYNAKKMPVYTVKKVKMPIAAMLRGGGGGVSKDAAAASTLTVEQLQQASAAELKAFGDGLTAGTRIGPLIDEAALKKVEAQIDDALARGARLLVGGTRAPDRPAFMMPTVLSDVTSEMLVARQETFGPVAQIFRFKGEAEALALANDTEYGLASYFYTRDLNRTIRISEGLEFGMVGINTGQISTAMAPFGGIKQAGMGREGSRYGIEDYLEMKYLCLDTGES